MRFGKHMSQRISSLRAEKVGGGDGRVDQQVGG
jgi:hypothetical protein